MIRFILICTLAFFARNAFPADKASVKPVIDDSEQAEAAQAMHKAEFNHPKKTVEANADVETNEQVVHRHNLSTHMGWEGEDAVFKAPRNFRSKELNEFNLDASPDTIEPISDNR